MAKRNPAASESAESPTGVYKYDRALGRMVKISDRVPGRKRRQGSPAPEAGPCGRSACGGGRCAGQ
jgi:hypothetical protein